MSMLTYQEIKQFLEQTAGQYFISRATFRDLTGGRTRVLFQLKNASYKKFLEQLPVHSMNGELQCGYTYQDLFELLEKYNQENPDGTISFSASESETDIMFDIKGLQKNLQSSKYKTHTVNEANELPEIAQNRSAGSKTVYRDKSMGRTRISIQLDQNRRWFLVVYFDDSTGALVNYELDYEGPAYESHLEFTNEAAIREKIYQPGDEKKYLEDLFIRYIEEHSGDELEALIKPYITAQYHYD